MKSDAVENFSTGLDKMGLSFAGGHATLDRLVIYFNELKKWNKKMNLVARQATDREILENHFLDSLTLLPTIQESFLQTRGDQHQADLMDVGTGAGFPGLVMKIACPELDVVLVEPRSKRVSFLKHIIRTLQLEKVTVADSRLEDMASASGGRQRSFTFITSRALTDIATFLEMVKPFTTAGSRVICMKGPKGNEEMKAFQNERRQKFFKLLEIKEYHLPFSNATRLLLFFGRPDSNSI